MEETNKAVLLALEQDLLQPEVWTVSIQKALARLQPSENDHAEQRQQLEHELNRIEEELGRLTSAIASGGGVPSLIKDQSATRA